MMGTTRTRRAHTPHACPHCRCDWDLNDDPGQTNPHAEFFPLVQLIDRITYDIGPRSRPHRLTYYDNHDEEVWPPTRGRTRKGAA